jgi:hypothetical protein
MTDVLDRRRSVTAGDFLSGKPTADGGVWYFQVYDPGSISTPAPELPPRSLMTWNADAILRATLDLEDMWAAAINQATTKLAVRGFEISDSDDSALKTRRAQDLVMNFDGPAEYRSGVSKLAQDFLLTRNGCFLEVERVSKAPNSKPKALWHLDSLRCRRTANPEYPVVYQDTLGQWHPMRQDQVIYFADMPSASVLLYGVGRPAAERAFKTIVKLAAVETYFREKITGARALKLVFISGVSNKQLRDTQDTSNADMERRGLTTYKGAVIIPTNDDRAISIAEVDLAGVPDGFEVVEERKDAYLRYANAIGIPVQDIQPLSGQGLGTGTQTLVLDEAASGRGLEYFPKALEDRINWLLMPKTTTFIFKTNDLRDQQQKAEVQAAQAALILSLVGRSGRSAGGAGAGGASGSASGAGGVPAIITPEQALNMLVDAGVVPKEFLPKDMTPEGTVTDSGDQSKPAADGAQPLPGVVQQAMALVGQKDEGDVDALVTDEYASALKWARHANAD